MERRQHERYSTNGLQETRSFSIDNVNDAEFIDYSQHGLSFSSNTVLSVGDRFNIRVKTERQSKIVSALVCNRCKTTEGIYRYGLFISNQIGHLVSV